VEGGKLSGPPGGDTTLNVFAYRLRKYPVSRQILILTDFFDRCSINPHILNFKKLHPVGAELFHTDRQTDRHDAGNIIFS